ncbi:MAG: multidrug resistance efflux transporter family protein [Lachnospiraceae bacterium]|nr:multidrug resistance efflux transporter family protein [Lachnospiraceae bacterium]MDD3616824.1 multidrug resistance efflux transporter family protein [Lachnospiraceae bacterium]
MRKALIYGVLGSLFFAFTFIFNRSMNLAGGNWMWSACLRYIFTLPIMAVLVWKEHGMKEILEEIRQNIGKWLLWSTVGFGLFYAPLSMASIYGASWFVAATWQITIVAGVLLTPLFGHKIPVKNLLMSVVILAGIVMLQINNVYQGTGQGVLPALGLILVAAFSYPLGNRKMMSYCPSKISTIQRVFGMTLCSMPFWLMLSGIACVQVGLPSAGQSLQAFIVALFSGVIATVLFFEATNLVKSNPKQLAVIEATQSGEVIFTLIGSLLFLGDTVPTVIGFIGVAVVVIGMIANSLISVGR